MVSEVGQLVSEVETEDRPPDLEFPAPLGDSGKVPPAPSLAGADTAPKRRGRPPGSKNASTMSIRSIEEGLNQQFTLVGTVIFAMNEYDGKTILQGSPQLAKSLASLCDKNPKVKRNIERMLAGGTYGEVIIAASMIAVPIMANHNLMPPAIKQMYGQAIPEEEETVEVPVHLAPDMVG